MEKTPRKLGQARMKPVEAPADACPQVLEYMECAKEGDEPEIYVVCALLVDALGWNHLTSARRCASCSRKPNDPAILKTAEKWLRKRVTKLHGWDEIQGKRRPKFRDDYEASLASYENRTSKAKAKAALVEAVRRGMMQSKALAVATKMFPEEKE